MSKTWQQWLADGVDAYLDQCVPEKDNRNLQMHLDDTPHRVVKAFEEYVSGYAEDPAAVLAKSFEDSEACDGMVHMYDIPVVSTCIHHLAPILGQAHFAYIPMDRVVGLSKIPRFIDILSRRLQIQERLCHEIVTVFPAVSCAVEIIAYHCCIITRGVRAHATPTVTSSLRGAFKTHQTTRAEFFARPQGFKLL